jgi:hypothetical protein
MLAKRRKQKEYNTCNNNLKKAITTNCETGKRAKEQ